MKIKMTLTKNRWLNGRLPIIWYKRTTLSNSKHADTTVQAKENLKIGTESLKLLTQQK